MTLRRAFVVLALLGAGLGGFWRGPAPATAQDGGVPAATVIAGTCDVPGAVVATLRDPATRDGGAVLVSLITVDLALPDLLGDAHAIVLTAGEDPTACGDVSGDAGDVYVGVTAIDAGGWGGVAWLHAKGEQTQVSLFVAQGLSGTGIAPTVVPTDEPPQPPDDVTPTPSVRATRTPGAGGTSTPGSGATYTSPSYGYALAYDAKYWDVSRDETTSTDAGPLDVLGLAHTGYTTATLVGETGRTGFTARDLCDVRLGQTESDPQVSDVVVREETRGDDDQASVVYDYTYTNDHRWLLRR